MMRPACTHKGSPCIAIYMPMIRELCELTLVAEKDMKSAVKEIGGTCNGSGVFLSTTSSDCTVNKSNGINRRFVLFIPRKKINQDILHQLDCTMYTYTHV